MKVTDQQLLEVRDELIKSNLKPTSQDITIRIKDKHNIDIDHSTIRGRFIAMGEPLGGPDYGKKKATTTNSNIESVVDAIINEETMPEPEPITQKQVLVEKNYEVKPELRAYIPKAELFDGYIERNIDKRLARAYDLGKYPLTQGKQGTGKTLSHQYYAYKKGLPLFLFCCYEDFVLEKLFGDRTIKNGDVKFQETEFTIAIQHPSVILFDEVNALSHANTIQFNTLLQNRCLFIKDAADGQGKVFQLHPDCKIGFAQNPKSQKYIGGNIRSSNFLGRCVHITYPDFTKKELDQAVTKRFPQLITKDREMFIAFYGGIVETIEQGQIPIDVSIRQLNNIIDLWLHGASLQEALEDGLLCMTDSASQPKCKDALWRIAQAVWKDLMKDTQANRKIPEPRLA